MTTFVNASEVVRETLCAATADTHVSEVIRETLCHETARTHIAYVIRETLRNPYRTKSMVWRYRW